MPHCYSFVVSSEIGTSSNFVLSLFKIFLVIEGLVCTELDLPHKRHGTDCERKRSLACCHSPGHKELDTPEQLNNNKRRTEVLTLNTSKCDFIERDFTEVITLK